MNKKLVKEIESIIFALQNISKILSNDNNQQSDRDWLRMPAKNNRCPVSNWSRSTIYRRITNGDVQFKKIKGTSFYSLKNVVKND